ncbi:hypothetical protein CTRI78_v008163 [Colletotrichum trifolii]|uniref:Uncharacterized protein n=1 Tax=Colletotrichum trifolii TaxID=5466 RepID=A0A4V3HUH7_COLTR|nr:hypothetical protein CTRI78_v008163 [Colletotrichum trifolii]
MPYYIYINGYPGIGKLTVAKELQGLLPNSKVYHNRLLIDPIAPIVELEDVRRTTWIFTDSRSTSPSGATAAEDYQRAAEQRGAKFTPIMLHYDLEENLRRIANEEQLSGENTKLTDKDILQPVQEEEDLCQFGGVYEL